MLRSLLAIAIVFCPWAASWAQELLPEPRILLGPPQLTAPLPTTDLILAPPPPAPPSWLKRWCGELEMGINGTDGNSETHKLRTAGKAKYTCGNYIFTFDVLYTYADANDKIAENRALSNIRSEWLLPGSNWSVFLLSVLEYDEFKAFDLRVAPFLGLGYDWFNSDRLKLKTRAGAGGSWEFGGPNHDFMPEADLGVDFEKKLTERQRIIGTIDLYPDLTVFGQCRVQAKVSYEILIDPAWNLALRLGVLDRYDSTPEGKKHNDIDYFATLLWKF